MDSAYFAVYVAKNETDRILKKMKINFIDLPKVYYFNPKKFYSDHNEYELIEQDKEFRNKFPS
jgi:DNA-directed RNA polymerase subunit H (RpoH/RPB5)